MIAFSTVLDNAIVNGIEITTSGGGGTPPSAPTLTATAGNASVALSWTTSTGASSYTVMRGTSTGNETTTVTSNFVGTSFNDAGLTNGTQYFYVVKAINSVGTAISGEKSATPVQPNVAPSPPTLTATPGNASVALSWTTSTGTPTPAYTVMRGTSTGQETTTLASNQTGTTFNDTGLTNGTQYFYVVKAINSVGTATSGEKSATPVQPNVAPSPPTLTATPGNASVALSWTTSTGTPTPTYTIMRGTSSGQETTTLASSQTGTTFNDTGLTNGTQYFYIVKAINSVGTATSTEKGAIPSGNTAPTTPTLTATPGNASVSLSWTTSTGTPTPTYTVMRGTSSGQETTTLTSNQTGTTFNDTGLTNGTTYWYIVKAINSVGTATSPEKSAIPSGGVPGIDLIVTSISWTPTTLSSGAHVVFSAVIKNQGSVATPAGTVIGCQFAIDGHTSPITWSDTNSTSLAPGASVTLTANNGTNAVNYWPAVSGSHTVQAWVDDVNRIAESNEGNNKTTAPITVP